MLLHHVAGNPMRAPLPANIVDVARLLIEAGADVNAETLEPRGGVTTMGLVLTSQAASQAGVSGPLMDLLLAHGAELDVHSPDVLHQTLADHGLRAAEKMIELGADADLCALAALGRMDRLRDTFGAAGELTGSVRRHGAPLSARDSIGLAMLFAYVSKCAAAVDLLLEKDGNWNMTGVNNGTALHRAAWDADRDMVARLLARGADPNDRHNPFNATPLSWADHNGQREMFEWMQARYPVDVHDAVCFGLGDHLRARLAEDPGCVHKTIDQWNIPRSTPLHQAAHVRRADFVALLLDHGAAPNAVAGDGRTSLDIAEDRGATQVAALLARRGGSRAAEL
jgi:hypothetical protein